jgi:hypothetical protein
MESHSRASFLIPQNQTSNKFFGNLANRYALFNKSEEKEYDEESSESCYDEEIEELHCKNLDPALAKLMGIQIEEQKTTDWIPPSKSGLDNSKEIIPSNYFKNNNKGFKSDLIEDDFDYFQIIKENILNYKPLTQKQLEYIKKQSNEHKFELIELYNSIFTRF